MLSHLRTADMQRSSPFQTLSLGEGQKCSGSSQGILAPDQLRPCAPRCGNVPALLRYGAIRQLCQSMDRVLPDAYRYGDFGNNRESDCLASASNRRYRLTHANGMFPRMGLADLVDPQRSSPAALREIERKAGGSAFISSHWIWNECVRLTALTGLRYATEPEKGPEILKLPRSGSSDSAP